MAGIDTAHAYGLHIRESANDGSDFANADADYRKLFLGEDGGLWLRDSAGAITQVGIGSGSAFPTGINTNARFYRTDLGMQFFYDGTRWRCTCLHQLELKLQDQDNPHTATSQGGRAAIPAWSGSDIFLVGTWTTVFIAGGGTALGASHKWVGVLAKQPSGTTLDTVTLDSGSSSAYRRSAITTIGAVLTMSTQLELDIFWTKTGTPGNLYEVGTTISFNYVAT